MADKKRDESDDVGIMLIDEESRSDEIGTFIEDAEWWQHLTEDERKGRTRYVPASELEAAQKRTAEAWSEGFDACQEWLEPPDGVMGRQIPSNPYATESLLTEKPADAK